MQAINHYKKESINPKKGFTLIELSLSIAFIGILSITIALIINNAIISYRRGMTLNQINTVGMDIVDDMRAAVQNSSTSQITDLCDSVYGSNSTPSKNCKTNSALSFVSIKSRKYSFDDIEVPLYGIFCTGTYSYAWNSGYLYSSSHTNISNNTLSIVIDNGKSGEFRDFRLLKIPDPNRAVCTAAAGGYSDIYNTEIKDKTINIQEGSLYIDNDEPPYDLLSGDKNKDKGLAFYDLSSSSPISVKSGHSSFYSLSFILGTINGGINIKASGDFCKPPEGYDSSFDYCAINKFNFAVQATGV